MKNDTSVRCCCCCDTRATQLSEVADELDNILQRTPVGDWVASLRDAKKLVEERNELAEKVIQLENALAREKDMLSIRIEAHEATCKMLLKKSIELFQLKRNSPSSWSSMGPSGSFGNNTSGSQGEPK